MARGICKDDYLADDLVSEMYLKLSTVNKEVNEAYVYYTIKSLYVVYLKDEKRYCDIGHAGTSVDQEPETPSQSIELPDTLTWVEKQILLLRTERSGRDIEKQYHINFQKVHRIEKRAKQKLEQWAKTYVEPVTL